MARIRHFPPLSERERSLSRRQHHQQYDRQDDHTRREGQTAGETSPSDTTVKSRPLQKQVARRRLLDDGRPWYDGTLFANDLVWSEDMPEMFQESTELKSCATNLIEAPAQPKPVPQEVLSLAEYVNKLPMSTYYKWQGLPSRSVLRKDDRLRSEFDRKNGYLRHEKSNSLLRAWVGDERLFSKAVWEYLAPEESASPHKVQGSTTKASKHI